jgi:zeaxanthin glucosyltransferase
VRFGIACFPGVGHLNAMFGLAQEAKARGHQVIFFQFADLKASVEKQGFECCTFADRAFPLGTIPEMDAALGNLSGTAALRFSIERIRRSTTAYFEYLPECLRGAGLDVFVVDQVDVCGPTIAERIAVPFVSICNALPLNRDYRIPPCYTGWRHRSTAVHHIRNELGYRFLSILGSPVRNLINKQRTEWGLGPLPDTATQFAGLAEIAQLPMCLDYPKRRFHPRFHYAGPLSVSRKAGDIDFVCQHLVTGSYVYASMGTLQNRRDDIYAGIIEGCYRAGWRVVLSVNNSTTDIDILRSLPGDPIVLRHASQPQMLKKAAAVITHAGLNTALESLSEGLPMVAVPMTNDQPGVAERLRWKGVAEVLPRSRVTGETVCTALTRITRQSSYREAAQRLKEELKGINGAKRAVDIIETSVNMV